MKLSKKKFLLSLSFTALTFNSITPIFAATFNYGEALQKAITFYDIQRLGKISAGSGNLSNRIYWRGDSFLQDYVLPNEEGTLDLGGGFADAGDNPKFNFPMAASMTMLAWGVIEFRDAYTSSGQLNPLLANLRWGMDYLLKCWDPVNNRLYGQVSPNSVQAEHSNLWMPYEVIDQASIDKNLPRFGFYVDKNHPGTDLAGETVAALASASLAFQATDAAYANKLLQTAVAIYNNLVNVPNKGKYSDNLGRMVNGSWVKADVSAFYNSWSGFNDEVSWAAMWLYRCTQDTNYLTVAKQFVPFGNKAATQSWDDKSYGTYLLMAKLLPDSDPAKATAKSSAQGWLNAWANGTNGHGFSTDGLAIASALSPWGNARYAASTAFTALIYDAYFNTTVYDQFAKKQIDVLLGDNRKNFSYLTGFGTSYPKQPHHATAEGRWGGNNDVDLPIDNRHVDWGGLVGGPKDLNDTYEDKRGDYIGNEVALDYNAGLVGALAGLYAKHGGTPLPSDQFPPSRAVENPPKDEYFVNGAVQSTFKDSVRSSIQVSLLATNHSAWPARVSRNLKIRYFLNLADKPSNGTVDVRTFSTDPRAVVSPLKLYDPGKQIYYVEVWFKDIPIYPGGDERQISSKETQLQFQFNWPHDYTKDWSYQNLGAQGSFKEAPNIPIYDIVNGTDKLLFGAEPTSVPQGTLALNFANNLPSACLGATDVLMIGSSDSPSIKIGTPFTYTMAVGGPYAVKLNSTTNPIAVTGGTCQGALDQTQVNVPGQLNASYTFVPTPPVEQGTIQISVASGSDPKCNTASDKLFIDGSATGTTFTVANGVSQAANVGSHTVKLASQTSIPAVNSPGYCTSTLSSGTVDVSKDAVSTVNATYQYHENSTNMTCTIVSSKVTQQSDWGPVTGLVNTFEIKFDLKNFPQDPQGKTLVSSTFVMKNDFQQNFWGNFNITSSSFNKNEGTFKGEVWKNQLPVSVSGFINNKVPLKVGDNPMTSFTVNGVQCK